MEGHIFDKEVLKTFIICGFSFAGFILLIMASKFKWLSGFTIGKLNVKGVIDKQYQAGTSNKLLDNAIDGLDKDLITFAIKKATDLRRSFTRRLFEKISCNSTRKALVSALRFPIYEACRTNNFKEELKPENIKAYVSRIMKEVADEYGDFALEHSVAICPKTNEKCSAIPSIEDIYKELEAELLEDFALPIKKKQLDICENKIKLYKQYITTYKEVGDFVKIKVAEHCMKKNENYIASLNGNALEVCT